MNLTSKLLGFVIALQGAILAVQLLGQSALLPHAEAQPADSGVQRFQMIEQQLETNRKLDALIELLKSGDLQVKAILPDQPK